MKHVPKMLERVRRLDDRGVAAVEYALIVALIALTFIAGLTNLGGAVGNQYAEIDSSVASSGTKFEH